MIYIYIYKREREGGREDEPQGMRSSEPKWSHRVRRWQRRRGVGHLYRTSSARRRKFATTLLAECGWVWGVIYRVWYAGRRRRRVVCFLMNKEGGIGFIAIFISNKYDIDARCLCLCLASPPFNSICAIHPPPLFSLLLSFSPFHFLDYFILFNINHVLWNFDLRGHISAFELRWTNLCSPLLLAHSFLWHKKIPIPFILANRHAFDLKQLPSSIQVLRVANFKLISVQISTYS